MDKKEIVLRKLSTIALNNKILELNNIIEEQSKRNSASYDKSKQLFTELMQNNKKLSKEKVELEEKLSTGQEKISELTEKIDELTCKVNYQQAIIEKVPKFLLKFIMRNKDIKLLNEKNK